MSDNSCPVCGMFESADAGELAAHVDECLNAADERMARDIAASEAPVRPTVAPKIDMLVDVPRASSSSASSSIQAPAVIKSSATSSKPASTLSIMDFDELVPEKSAPSPKSKVSAKRRSPSADLSSSDDEDGTKADLRAMRAVEDRRRAQERADEELARKFAAEDANDVGRAGAAAGAAGGENVMMASMCCKLCSASDLRGGPVMLDVCLHVFCSDCISPHLTRACQEWRNGDAPGCPTCSAALSPGELQSLITADVFAAFCDRQARSALTDSMYISCVNEKCQNVMERLPAADVEARRAKDAVERCRLEYRMRCRECDEIFCASCRASPFHDSYTCESFEKFSKSRHCRFCDAAIEAKKPAAAVVAQVPASSKAKPPATRRRSGRRAPVVAEDEIVPEPAGADDDDVILANEDVTTVADVCDDEQCVEASKLVCRVRHAACKHACQGVRGESKCLRCLRCDAPELPEGDGSPESQIAIAAASQTGEDFCGICYTDSLLYRPSIQLACGHIFHAECAKEKLSKRWPSPCISFSFSTCPVCKAEMSHVWLNEMLKEIRALNKKVTKSAVQRMKVEGLSKDAEASVASGRHPDVASFAMAKLAYYMCAKCKKPYFGGLKECANGANADQLREFNPDELVCGPCSGATEKCDKHGTEYIEWKCRFCCKLATFFCGSKCHFCNDCHAKPGTFVDFSGWKTKKDAPMTACPGPGNCGVGGMHKPNGEESPLGCAMCRADAFFGTKGGEGGDDDEDDDDDDDDSGSADEKKPRRPKKRRTVKAKKGAEQGEGFLSRLFQRK